MSSSTMSPSSNHEVPSPSRWLLLLVLIMLLMGILWGLNQHETYREEHEPQVNGVDLETVFNQTKLPVVPSLSAALPPAQLNWPAGLESLWCTPIRSPKAEWKDHGATYSWTCAGGFFDKSQNKDKEQQDLVRAPTTVEFWNANVVIILRATTPGAPLEVRVSQRGAMDTQALVPQIKQFVAAYLQANPTLR